MADFRIAAIPGGSPFVPADRTDAGEYRLLVTTLTGTSAANYVLGTGTATLTFRAARDTPTFRLDLARPLEVASVTLDGDEAAYRHRGKDE